MSYKSNGFKKLFQRGDVYFCNIPYHTGCEMDKDRPALIVSCNEMNESGPTIVIVFLSSSNQHDYPQHVKINSVGKNSVALCEHIYTVDKSRMNDYMGTVSKEEMQKIDAALMVELNIANEPLARPQEAITAQGPETDTPAEESTCDALYDENLRLSAQLEVYRALYGELISKLTA